MASSLAETTARLVRQMVETCSGVVAVILDPVTARCVNPHLRDYISPGRILIYEQIGVKSSSLQVTSALVFIQPASLHLLEQELRNPRYREYYLFISGPITNAELRQLAEADVSSVVETVEEYYLDYYLLGPRAIQLCSPGLSGLTGLFTRRPTLQVSPGMDSLKQRLMADLADPRFSGNVQPPTLLLGNRSLDALTPLLLGCVGTPMGTYQSLLHELIGIEDQTVTIQGEKFQLEDEYFAQHMYDSYTGLVSALDELRQKVTNSIQRKEEASKTLSGLSDYLALELRKDLKTRELYSKHAKILLHLSDLITQHQLVECAILEQKIVCARVRAEEVILRMLDPTTRPADALRLAALYALYHGYSAEIVTALQRLGLSYDPIARFVSRGVVNPAPITSPLSLFGVEKPLERYSPWLLSLKTPPSYLYLEVATYLEAKMARDLGFTLVAHSYVNSRQFLEL